MITIYTKDNCPYCVKSKALLKSYGLEYTEIAIDRDISREDFLERFPTIRTVPQIIIDGEHVRGYQGLVNKLAQ